MDLDSYPEAPEYGQSMIASSDGVSTPTGNGYQQQGELSMFRDSTEMRPYGSHLSQRPDPGFSIQNFPAETLKLDDEPVTSHVGHAAVQSSNDSAVTQGAIFELKMEKDHLATSDEPETPASLVSIYAEGRDSLGDFGAGAGAKSSPDSPIQTADLPTHAAAVAEYLKKNFPKDVLSSAMSLLAKETPRAAPERIASKHIFQCQDCPKGFPRQCELK